MTMATGTYGVLSGFDHLSQDWQTYKNRLLQFFIANDLDEIKDKAGVKRKAILLSALTEASYKLASDLALPTDVAQLNFEAVLNILDTHFTPKRCGFAERHRFYSAKQHPGEGHSQWAARIRGLAAHCGFKNLEETLLDRFVMGMVAGHERDKLFTHDLQDLTLNKAIDLAESVRCARDAASAVPVGSGTRDAVTREVGLFNIKNKVIDKCSVCGYTNHNSVQCRFKNYKCKKCGQKGHLHRMCSSDKVKRLEVGCGDEGDDGKLFCNIRCPRDMPMIESVNVGGVVFEFEIDSGSPINVISHQTYKTYFNHLPLSRTNKSFNSYTGEKMPILGYICVTVTYLGRTRALDMFVVRDGGPPLLGRSFMCAFDLEIAPATNKLQYCNESDEGALNKVIAKFPKLFSGTLGCFNEYEVKLYLKPDSKPIFFKARPVAFALKDKVDKELKRLVALGVLKPVEHSEYASPIVPVLKNDGSVRLCADFSVTINKQLIVEKYPLPTINEMFSKLHDGKYYSKLDLSMAYAQFRLSEDSQRITCINTHRGLFVYTRMVYGMSSAAAIFQRAMECLLSGIEGVLCFQDDILIAGSSKFENLDRLSKVLQRLQDAGLTVQTNKCEFLKKEISYLGHIIDAHGVRKSTDKVTAILNVPIPKTVAQLQSFLGLVNYYRDFIPDASSILNPLYKLLHKSSKWFWTPSHNDAFEKVKNILASDQVLTHFNPNAQIILTVDASPYGLGAILSQICIDGLERPISYASRTLTAAESRYSQIQKEATAIIFGVKRFHQYLYGRSEPFILRTDHKPLITIFGPYRGIPEVSANRLQRYAIFLAAYNYKIEFIRSFQNNADFLSRSVSPSTEHSESKSINQFEDSAAYVNFVVDGTLPINIADLRAETTNDVVLNAVSNYVLNGWPKKISDLQLKPFFNCRLQLSLENGCLMRGHKVVVPRKLRNKVCNELHSSHFGIVKLKAAARARFWFPGIDAYLEELVNSCDVCAQLRPSPPRAPLTTWPFPPHAFYRVHIDFLGPINNKMYLVVVDAYSKWVECYPMNVNIGSKLVIEKLNKLMSRFGIFHTIVSDNGPSFASKEFDDFCHSNGIKHVFSPPYNPASNGQAESLVKVIKKGIKSIIINSDGSNVSNEKLLKFLFDYRNSKNSTTDKSPAEIIFGRPLRCRLDLLNPSPVIDSSADLSRKINHKQCVQAKYYRGISRYDFKENDEVWVKKQLTNKKFYWQKGIIKKLIGKAVYLVFIPESNIITKKHKNQLWIRKNIESSGLLASERNYSWNTDCLDCDQKLVDTFSESDNLLQNTYENNISEEVEASEAHIDDGASSVGPQTVSPPPPQTPVQASLSDTLQRSPEFSTPSSHVSENPQKLKRNLRNLPIVNYKE